MLHYIKTHYKNMDYSLLALVIGLILYGLAMVYSATMYTTEFALHPDPLGYIVKQLAGVVIGGVLFNIAILIPFRYYRRLSLVYAFNIVLGLLLAWTLITGTIGGGAKSWLSIGGLRVQPSEFSKVGLIMLSATFFYCQDYQRRQLAHPMYLIDDIGQVLKKSILFESHWGVLKDYKLWIPVVLTGGILAEIMLQPDMGMFLILCVVILGVWVTHFWKPVWNVIGYVTIACVFIVARQVLTLFRDYLVSSGNYKLQRLGSFINPFDYAQDAGYQLIGAYLAFSRGGLFGVGLGKSITKQHELPAGHTDFILAVVGEELGLFGVIILLLLLLLLIIRMFYWAIHSRNLYRKLIFTGIAFVYLIQILVNVGGIAGLIPLTGVTLPFISYGGSSMMFSLFAMGVFQACVIEEKQQQAKQLVYQQEGVKHNDI